MVNQKNKQTFSPPWVGEVSNLSLPSWVGEVSNLSLPSWVGEVSNLAGAECTINSKVYHSITYLLYMYFRFSTIGASVFAWGVFAWAFPLIGYFLNFFILAILRENQDRN